MTIYRFRFKHQDGEVANEECYEFVDLAAALDEAKRVLGEIAGDGLPSGPDETIAVELLNVGGNCDCTCRPHPANRFPICIAADSRRSD
ncbi:hypothetical protein [Rhizobium sp. L9]|uniref:DUF6894 family protein n=1 Tax=Rhizobium sp. L9 TaxID=1340738 RepID=UPI0011441829|nr:hypothetical protein [Rhizobium sp. L9]